MLLADVSFGDVLLSIVFFFFWFIWIMIVINILMDLFRDPDVSGGMKALWCILLVFFTPITALVYLITRGKGMAERGMQRNIEAQQQYTQYMQQMASASGAGGGGAAAEISHAKQLLDSGAITQAEFDQLKAKALSS